MKPSTAPRYPNFDLLRLILALSVPFLHAWNQTGSTMKGLFPAVPGFLALSGFLVLQSYENSRGPGHFFWKRLLRVGPAFIASFVLVAIFFGIKAIPATLANWYTFGQSYDGGKNNVLWSLACEEVLYVSLVLLWFAGAYKRVVWTWVLFAASIVGTCVLLPHIYNRQFAHVVVIAFLPSAFFAGNLAYHYREQLMKAKPIWPTCLFVASLSLYPLLPRDVITQYLHQTVAIIGLIWFGIAGPKIPIKLPVDISYGVYLYHLMVLEVAYRSGVTERFPLMATTIVGAVAVSLLSAILIEQPALKLKNHPWRFPKKSPRVKPVEPVPA